MQTRLRSPVTGRPEDSYRAARSHWAELLRPVVVDGVGRSEERRALEIAAVAREHRIKLNGRPSRNDPHRNRDYINAWLDGGNLRDTATRLHMDARALAEILERMGLRDRKHKKQ